MNKLRLVALIAILLLTVVVPTQAQDDDLSDEQMIEMVIAAFENLNAATYYQFSATQDESQVIGSGEGLRRATIAIDTERTFSSGRVQMGEDGDPVAVDVVVNQDSELVVNSQSRNALDLTMDMHLIQVDGGLYVQINTISGTLHDEMFARLRTSEQEDVEALQGLWVNIIEAPEDLEAMLAYLDTDTTEGAYLTQIDPAALLDLNRFTLESAMVLDIRQLPSESTSELIFEIELDPAQLLTSLDFGALPEGNTLLEEMFAGMTITQTVTLTLDADGNPLPTAMETVMDIMVEFSEGATDDVPLDFTLNSTSNIQYSRVGSEFEITAPENPVEEETTDTSA